MQKRGFTLIETLVAITILMIAIAGPLTVATKAYTASLDARNQTIATNLAQETMEYLNNMKDNEISGKGKGTSWIGSNECRSEANHCDMDLDTGSKKANKNLGIISCSSFCRLNESDSLGYNHQDISATNKVSPFYRYFYLTDLNLNDSSQIMATVVVYWSTGSISNDITLQEVLSSVER